NNPPTHTIHHITPYSQNSNQIIHKPTFHCTDLGPQIKAAVEAFKGNEQLRTCKKCGVLADWSPKPGSIQDPNVQ
ncbi:hypothetical protein OFM35_31160, partial [Escherichia coli]|nr:hypothetical protein [Escherichia coli]